MPIPKIFSYAGTSRISHGKGRFLVKLNLSVESKLLFKNNQTLQTS